MLRGENIICGTSSTGTGALTLAACPVPPGGVDLYTWLTSTGMNFVNGNALLTSYTLIEFTDTTFATALQSEQGVATITLGANLAATTLARTTVQSTQTTENTTGVYAGNAPSAININTAANVLVFIGTKAADLPAYSPHFETSIGDNLGVGPVISDIVTVNNNVSLTTGLDCYYPFDWRTPMLAKKLSVNLAAAYTGGTSNLYGRIYQINSSGRPGKLLIDFGKIGTSNAGLASTGNISSAVHSTGFMLIPGEYFLDLLAIFSGGSGSPILTQYKNSRYPVSSRFGTTSMGAYNLTTASSGNATAPDPANTTGYAGVFSSINNSVAFTLAPS